MIDDINNEDIVELNIPTGIPLLYEFNENLKPVSKRFIGNQEIIEKATKMVANQGMAKEMIYSIDKSTPKYDASNFIAENATIIGKVNLNSDVSIWFNVVIRGDNDPY